MEYVVHRRFKRKGIGGEFNLPRGIKCEEVDGTIILIKYHFGLNFCLVAVTGFVAATFLISKKGW